ncbi:MAG TPA: hypothetical protein VEB40_12590, partial [Flavipsychrobacter sp.]|nr:hypothetical protein [Flavipsychrobacter sp.]
MRDDIEGRDSIFDLALGDLYTRAPDSLQVELYNWYFDREEEYFTDRAKDYVRNFVELVNKHRSNVWFSNVYYAKSKLALYLFNTKDAIESASQAFYYASLTNNPELEIKSMLLLGTSLESNNKKVEAFKKYIDAS